MSHRPLLHAQSFLLVLREHEARKIPTPAMHRRFSVSIATGPGPHLKTHESCFQFLRLAINGALKVLVFLERRARDPS